MKLRIRNRVLVCAAVLLSTQAHGSPAANALDLLRQSIQQMGGEYKLRQLQTVRFEAIGYRNALEESERPEGPYIVEYQQVSESLDTQRGQWKRKTEMRWQVQPLFNSTVTVSDGAAARNSNGQTVAGSSDQLRQAEERLALGPERILQTAIVAPDVHTEADLILQGVLQHVVAFTWRGSGVHLFLNSNTLLPTAVEWKAAYPSDVFWSVWGDVTTRVCYSLWWLAPNGIHYPLQWDTFRNNLPDTVLTISPNDLRLNVQLPADEFALSADTRQEFLKRAGKTLDDRPLGLPNRPAQELAKDLVFIPGAWNTTLIRQPDGIIVLEAPISSGYSARVIEEAQRRWPGVAIKAVISTSDSWPHIGGVREYIARGIPVYALDLNVPILQRVISAPRTFFPDLLARAQRQPNFRAVNNKTIIGEGPNRMELYPLRGETTERQMMVYFPEHKLLYGSDAFQRDVSGAYFYPQTMWEVMHAAEREKLEVKKFFMMHVGPTDWSDLQRVVTQAQQPSAP